MEYRGWIKVPGIDVESDEAGKLLDILNDRYGRYGPVLGGVGDGIEVTLSSDETDETTARQRLLGAVTDALIFDGFGQRPESIELELAQDDRVTA